jgi:hypothetical protein
MAKGTASLASSARRRIAIFTVFAAELEHCSRNAKIVPSKGRGIASDY